MIILQTKICAKCEEHLPVDRFWVKGNGKLLSYCKDCNAAAAKAWRQDHPEPARHRAKRWREANPERAKENSRKVWDRLRLTSGWESRAASRARSHAAPVVSFTRKEWDSLLSDFGGRCAYCDRMVPNLTIDHMLPLRRGGEHSITNIVPACRSCNSRKGKLTPLEYLAKRGGC